MFEGDNLCGDVNGMCTHYCFPLPAYDSTSKSTKTGCMCPDFFILKVAFGFPIFRYRAYLMKVISETGHEH
jgi:hypothetical protein